jgi:hypothetical protein
MLLSDANELGKGMNVLTSCGWRSHRVEHTREMDEDHGRHWNQNIFVLFFADDVCNFTTGCESLIGNGLIGTRLHH